MRPKFKLPFLRARSLPDSPVAPDGQPSDRAADAPLEASPSDSPSPPDEQRGGGQLTNEQRGGGQLTDEQLAGEQRGGGQRVDEPLTDEQAEAEAALARLEDRIGAFTAYTLAADFLELRQIYAGTFERTKEEDWAKKLDRRAEGWTRRQALAHVEAVTHTYNQAILAGLEGRPVEIPGFAQRADLKAVNRATIEARAEVPLAELIASFLGALEDAARLAAALEREQLGRLVPTPFFGATPTVAELFGSSIAHAGIVHGAQLAVSRGRPIWIYFQPGMMRRQLTRFIHMFGLAYWPDRGGDLHAAIGVSVEGQGGGSWVVRVGAEGGQGKIGIARTTDVSLTFASADLFCRAVTFQTQLWRQFVLRRIRVSGNLRLAKRLPGLFNPT